MSSTSTDTPLTFITRTAFELDGRIGSFYDIESDKILDHSIELPKQKTHLNYQPDCTMKTFQPETFPNLLKIVNMEPEQRLNIALKMVPIRRLAELFNYRSTIDQYTRLLHYTFCSEIELLSDRYLNQQHSNKVQLPYHMGSHVIVRVRYGIEAVAIIQLPPDEKALETFDCILNQICYGLKLDRSLTWTTTEKQHLQQMDQINVFSNHPSLTSIKSIVEFYQQVRQLRSQSHYGTPCSYILCPSDSLFTVDSQSSITFHPLSADQIESIEQYLHQLASRFNQMGIAVNHDYSYCHKHLRHFQDEIIVEWTHLQKMHDGEIGRIREWVKYFRRNGDGPSGDRRVLENGKVIEMKTRMDEFQSKLTTRNNKEQFLKEKLPKEFQYRNATNYKITENDDDRSLENKLIGYEKNICIVCSTDRLYEEHSSEWNKIYNEIREEYNRNPQLRLIYVDFTDHCYKLNQFKVFPLKEQDNRKDVSRSIVSTTSEVVEDDEMINVLLVGESGVGKSTFINALVNYLRYDTFEQAESSGPVILLPVSFLVTSGKNFDEFQVEYDGLDTHSSEDHDHPGQSVTQHCRSYIFTILDDQTQKRRKVRLIDTPGFGDVRGVEQDTKNTREMISFINNLTHLHAICILMKPNVTRLHIFFRSFLMQLFDVLGEDIRNNILFCFTNTRATFYGPGSTAPVLKTFVKEYPLLDLLFSKENSFCFDSESFRYLVAKQRGVQFESDEAKECAKTWTRSSVESKRFLNYIMTTTSVYQIHNNRQSRNNTQTQIDQLTRPILEVIRNHLRHVILHDTRSSNISIELRPKSLTDDTAICRQCPRQSREYGSFMILSDNPHIFHNSCLTCSCSSQEHSSIDYRLEYKMHNNPPSQSKETLMKIVDQLIDACAMFTYFVMNGSYNERDDKILSKLKTMIKEEEQNGKGSAGLLNVNLVEKLNEVRQRYEEVMNKKRRDNEKCPDLTSVNKWIDEMNAVDMIKLQMDAIRTWQQLMFKNYEFHVPM